MTDLIKPTDPVSDLQMFRYLKCTDIIIDINAPVVRRAMLAISDKVIEVTRWSQPVSQLVDYSWYMNMNEGLRDGVFENDFEGGIITPFINVLC